MEKRPCPSCGAPIAGPAIHCPSCGASAASSPYDRDAEHLNLLSVFHYVLAGIVALFACVALIHVTMGILLATEPGWTTGNRHSQGPVLMGWLFAIMGGMMLIGGLTGAALLFAAGRSIATRRRYVFCQVVAGLSCLMMPMGTVLGVFTLVVLSRPSVKALFKAP